MNPPETVFGRKNNPLNLSLLEINQPGDATIWRLLQNAAVWFQGVGNPTTQNGQLNTNMYYDTASGNVWQLQSEVWVQVATGGGSAGVSSLNSLTGAVNLVAGANQVITPSGNDLILSSIQGGADYLVSVENYGARAVYPVPQTTATVSASSTAAVLVSGGIFVQGDGVTIYGAGATNTMSTPSAPTVAPSIAAAGMSTGVVVGSPVGSTTYQYKIVARDKNGGLTAASLAGGTTVGQASLGHQQVSIASMSRANNIVTVTTAAPHTLSVGSEIYITLALPSDFCGFYIVSGVSDSTHFTYTCGLDTRMGAETATTTPLFTPNVQWFNCNSLTWGAVAGAWQYYIYKNISGVYTLVGVSKPSTNTDPSLFWEDYGSPIMDNYTAPQYVPLIAPTTATNDNLTTTIATLSGNNATLANAAINSVSGAIAILDAAPGIKAAATAAVAAQSVLYFPPASGGFFVESYLDLSSLGSLTVNQSGIIWLDETMQLPNLTKWFGNSYSVTFNSQPSFALAPEQGIIVGNACPGIYGHSASSSIYEGFLLNGFNGNNNLLMLLDDSYGVSFRYVNFNTAQSPAGDYMGMGFVVRNNGGAYYYRFDYCTWGGGPTPVETNSLTPYVYFTRQNTGEAFFNHCVFSTRTILGVADGFSCFLNDVYLSGIIQPAVSSCAAFEGKFENCQIDSASPPMFAQLSAGGSTVDIVDCGGPSQDTFVTGYPITSLRYYGAASSTLGLGQSAGVETIVSVQNNRPVINPAPSNIIEAYIVKAFLQPVYHPAPYTEYYGSLVPTGLAAGPATSGGSVPVGAHVYAVASIGQDGGVSAPSSSISVTVSSPNQTVPLTWNPVQGAVGYWIYRGDHGISASPTTAASFSDTFASAVGFSITVENSTGPTAISNLQIITPQLWLTAPLDGGISYKGIYIPAALTADRIYTGPDASGQSVVDQIVTKSSAYALTVADFWVNVTGTTTITVPHNTIGHIWHIQNSGSNIVSLVMDSGTINGATVVKLAPNVGCEVSCDGTNGTVTSSFNTYTFFGTTSGSATIGAAASAGTPNQINWPTSTGTAGYVISTDGGNPQQLSWVPQGGGAGGGTVTSFSSQATFSPLFTTSVTNNSTTPLLAFAQITQNANLIFAGPTSGSAANPTFRSLVVADIPSLPGTIITSGEITLAHGGTGNDLSATGGTSQVLKQLSTGASITVSQLNFTDLAGSLAISQTPLTTLGDILFINSAPALTRLAGNITATKNFLTQTGTGSVSAAPVWGTLAAGDIPALAASKITSGTMALAVGGTNANLSATGGTSQVLKQVSSGAAVTVGQLAYSDISGTPPIPISGTITDGSPITFDGSVHQGAVTITLAHTTATRALNVTNLTDGAVYTIIFIQDSTGGAQVTLGTGTTWKVGGNGLGTITLNTTANNQDRFVFQNIAGVCYATLQTQFN